MLPVREEHTLTLYASRRPEAAFTGAACALKSYLWLFFLVALSSTPVRAHDIYRHLVDGMRVAALTRTACPHHFE